MSTQSFDRPSMTFKTPDQDQVSPVDHIYINRFYHNEAVTLINVE